MKDGCSVTKLMDVATLINGRAFSKNEFHNNGKYPILRVGNFFSNDEWYYSNFELEENKYCDNGDLLFAWSASFGPKIWDGGKVIYHYHIWKLVLSDLVNKEYLYFYLQNMTEKIKKQGHGVTMQHVTKSDMEKMPINLPPFSEQKRIAEILTAADSAIEEADRAVKESERAKQGLMQKLIPDGKEGLKEGWKSMSFSECFKISPTNSFSRNMLTYDKGDILNIHYGDIHKFLPVNTDISAAHLPFIKSDVNVSKLKPESFCKNRDIVIADTAEDYAGVGKTIELHGIDNNKVVAGLHTYLCRDEKSLFVEGFCGYMMNSSFVHNQVEKLAAGMKVYSITKANLGKIVLPLPPLPEQKRIAEILSVADEKIELCKQRKALLVKTKQGLMQKLLGGIDV